MAIGKRSPIFYARWGCLLLSALLLLPFPFWKVGSRLLVQASAFVWICTLLAGGAFWFGSALGLAFSIISLFRKRWFCRHVCPVGVLLDTLPVMRSPISDRSRAFPVVGHYIALLTAAGAIFGYPLFLWMDPLALLNNAFSAPFARNALTAMLSLSGIIALLLITLGAGNLWCTRICPLGATQDLLHGTVTFFKNLARPNRTASHSTSSPAGAVSMARRRFIAIAAGVGSSLWAQKTGQARSSHAPLRPPGAIAEDLFTGLCLRCGNCVRACPSRIIHPDTGRSGILGFLSPVVRYETDYCREECNVCTTVCPSGALRAMDPDQKRKYIIGQARLERALCLWGISDCNACINACPFDAIKTYWDKEAYESYPVVDAEKCNGCGACEVSCPTGDIKAMRVLSRTDNALAGQNHIAG